MCVGGGQVGCVCVCAYIQTLDRKQQGRSDLYVCSCVNFAISTVAFL